MMHDRPLLEELADSEFERWMNDLSEEAKSQELPSGYAIGHFEGFARGFREGRIAAEREDAFRLSNQLSCSTDEALVILGVHPEDYSRVISAVEDRKAMIEREGGR